MVAIPVRGVDSCVAEFATADCDYIADLPHGIGLSSPSEAHEYVRVDGKLARLDTFTATSLPERSYGAAIHFDTLWGGEPFEAQLTIVAQCATREAQATARAVLQTVELPPVGVGDRTLEPSTEDCQGYDVRPVEGYVLGRSCVAPKSRVPGVCAIGSISNFSSGTGQSVCFVTAAGEYMSAFVRYGESIVGNGSRYGHGDVLPPPQLSADEEARCQMLVNLLEPTDAGANDITGERAYVGCP